MDGKNPESSVSVLLQHTLSTLINVLLTASLLLKVHPLKSHQRKESAQSYQQVNRRVHHYWRQGHGVPQLCRQDEA